ATSTSAPTRRIWAASSRTTSTRPRRSTKRSRACRRCDRRTPPAAGGGVRPPAVPHAALRQSRARPRLARVDGDRALVVPGTLAQRPGHGRALRRRHRPRHPGPVAPLRAPDPPDAAVGSCPVRARPRAASAPRRPRRRHAHRLVALRRRGSVLPGPVHALAPGARVRRPPDRGARARVAPRLHRRALLASLSALVPACRALAVFGRAAPADARPARLRHRRTRSRHAGAGTGLERGDAAGGQRAGSG